MVCGSDAISRGVLRSLSFVFTVQYGLYLYNVVLGNFRFVLGNFRFVLGNFRLCRFVKHIGQGKRKESEEENAIEEDAWGESCCDFGGQLAAHQSR